MTNQPDVEGIIERFKNGKEKLDKEMEVCGMPSAATTKEVMTEVDRLMLLVDSYRAPDAP